MKLTYYYNIVLEDVHEDRITLKLPRKVCYQILDYPSYLIDYTTSHDNNEVTLATIVETTDFRSGLRQAFDQAKEALRIISFLFDVNLTRLMDGCNGYSEGEDALKLTNNTNDFKNANARKLSKFNNHVNEMNKKDKTFRYSLSAIRYYSRFLELWDNELKEEAFLSLYKALELISNRVFEDHCGSDLRTKIKNIVPEILSEYFNEKLIKEKEITKDLAINNTVINELGNLITARRKILFALRHFDLIYEDCAKDIGPIVQLRNSVAAHGSNNNEDNFPSDLIFPFSVLVKKVIAKFLLSDNEKYAFMEYNIVRW